MSNSHPRTVREFLDQEILWVNKDGWVAIKDMNTTHRRRAAQFLLRRARLFGIWALDEEDPARFGGNEVQEFVGRLAAPATFIKNTLLYRRLVQNGADPEQYRGLVADD